MTTEEWCIYADTFGALKRFLRCPDVMVHLRAEPELCPERIKTRSRSEEAGISLDYLKRLHDEHDALAKAMSRFTRVLIFDWSSFDQTPEVVDAKINEALAEEVRFMRDFARL